MLIKSSENHQLCAIYMAERHYQLFTQRSTHIKARIQTVFPMKITRDSTTSYTLYFQSISTISLHTFYTHNMLFTENI